MKALLSLFVLFSLNSFATDSSRDQYICKSLKSSTSIRIQRFEGKRNQIDIAFGNRTVLVDYVTPFASKDKRFVASYRAMLNHNEPYALEMTYADVYMNFAPFKDAKGFMLLKMHDEYSSSNYPKPIVSNKFEDQLECTYVKFVP